jgi:hypothetical protein
LHPKFFVGRGFSRDIKNASDKPSFRRIFRRGLVLPPLANSNQRSIPPCRHINPDHIEIKVFATPHGSRELNSELLVWYYPPRRHVKGENIETKGLATRQVDTLV